jgi:hypothetical protein
MALWEGLRRVYFGTTELSPARDPVLAARAPIRYFNERTEVLFSQGVRERYNDETLHLVLDDEPDPAATLVIADLRREIAELEARARRRRAPDDSGRPPLPSHHDEDDDEPDPIELLYDFTTGGPGVSRDAADTPPSDTSRKGQTTQQVNQLHLDEETILTNSCDARFDKSPICDSANGEDEETIPVRNGEFLGDTAQSSIGKTSGEDSGIKKGMTSGQSADFIDTAVRRIFLTVKTLRRILNSKESIFKYGVFVPRNDNEADVSPEHVQWTSGRTLEWMRLQEQRTFERDWD